MTDQATARTSARRTRRQLLAAGTGALAEVLTAEALARPASNSAAGKASNAGASGVYGQNGGTGLGMVGRAAGSTGVRSDSANGVAVRASSQNGTAQKVTGMGRRANGRTARWEGSAMVVRWRGSLPVLVMAFLIFAVTSCSSKPPAVGETFAARATAVCQRALDSKQAWSPFPVANFDPAHPDPSALPKTAVWLQDQVTPTFQAWLHGLGALGTPPKARKAWSEVLAAVATIVQGNADEIAAAKAGDTTGFVAARDRLVAAQPELERATAAAGVPTCADVHKK